MNIYQLRQAAGREEIDYAFLLSQLREYREPRKKIQAWLENGDLIRVKKGLYIFGPKVTRRPFCQEWLANLIYGPSAISLEYALSYYGLTPEKVTLVSSITCQRNKLFTTPVGTFSYRYLPMEKYRLGIVQKIILDPYQVFIASPEKALVDKIYFSKLNLKSSNQMWIYLLDDLRINESDLRALNISFIRELAETYQHSQVKLLGETLRR